MKIYVDFVEESIAGDYGQADGVQATCTKCGHTTESFGTGEGSYKRCLALMREECPEGENNFYVNSDDAPAAAQSWKDQPIDDLVSALLEANDEGKLKLPQPLVGFLNDIYGGAPTMPEMQRVWNVYAMHRHTIEGGAR